MAKKENTEVKQVQGAKTAVVETEVEKLSKDLEALKAENTLLSEKLKLKELTTSKDCVVLDGKECKVILRETAKELLQAVRRSEVDEDATVLVLSVFGG